MTTRTLIILATVLAVGGTGALFGSSYFAGANRSAPVILAADETAPAMEAEKGRVLAALSQGDAATAEQLLSTAVSDYKAGRTSDLALRNLFDAFTSTDPALAPQLDAWMVKYPRSYSAHLARGIYYRSVGEEQRGAAYIRDTAPEKIAAMRTTFARAFEDLQNSLALDDRPVVSYMYLISVGKHLKPRAFLRNQLDASLRADPKNFIVRRIYFRSLRPQWGGSIDAMKAFLDESRKAGLPPDQIAEFEAFIESALASLANERGDADTAIRHYEKAIRVIPTIDEFMLRDYTKLLLARDRCDVALPIIDRLIVKNPKDGTLHASSGFCHARANSHADTVRQYTLAAEFGNAWAQVELGEMYFHGTWIEPNPEKARYWFAKAAAQGDERARKRLAGVHDH